MGSRTQFSVLAGQNRDLDRRQIHRLFEANLGQREPDNSDDNSGSTALISLPTAVLPERRISYATLNATANRYARVIGQHLMLGNIECRNADGDWIVAVCMPPSVDLIAVLLAIWKVGAAYLPLDASFPKQRIEHILNEAKPALTLVAGTAEEQDNCIAGLFGVDAELMIFAELASRAVNADTNNLQIKETLLGVYDGHNDDDMMDDHRLAIVLYTSGSTGIPKGVRMPHSILHNRLCWQLNTFPFAATERTAVFKTALTFVDSVAEIWAPLLCGLAVVVVPKTVVCDPERLVDVLEAYGIERLVLVPTLLRTLLMYLPQRRKTASANCRKKVALSRLRIWVCSGETLSAALVNEFYGYFGGGDRMLCNFYGSTEIMGDVTCHVCRADGSAAGNNAIVPIGRPIDNTIVYVLDGEMRPVKIGETGELFVAGRNLAAGYVNGRDEFRFVANPLSDDPTYNRLYRTGDFASVLLDGSLRYDGRTDSQIKIRGHRVDLTEVERQLMLVTNSAERQCADDMAIDDDTAELATRRPRIDKGLVLSYRAGEIDQALVAFVTLCNHHDDGNVAAAQHIEAALADRLADYMIPQIVVIDTIPLLVNGKVDRQSLLRLYADRSSMPTTTNDNIDSHETLQHPAASIDYSGVHPQHMHIARDLFETIAAAIGRSARHVISAQANYYHLGGNSLNSIYTVTQLRAMGYRVGIQEFIGATCLRDVVDIMAMPTSRMTTSSEDSEENSSNGTADATSDEDADLNNNDTVLLRFNVMPLELEHRSEVIDLMTRSFYDKADLESLLKPHIAYEDYAAIFEQLFDPVCRQGLSFVLYDAQLDCIVGAAFNTDSYCEPPMHVHSQLSVVFDFLREIQHTVLQLHETSAEGQLFHAGMMGTSVRLSAQENIAAVHCMELEVLRLAQSKGYSAIYTTNTSPLTQQLACHVHGYETVCRVQVNRWHTADGWRPFALATDEQSALVQLKRIG